MASLMLSAISLSDKLISLMLQELLSRTMGTCDEGTAGAQCPLAWAEQVTGVDTPGQGKGSEERGNGFSERKSQNADLEFLRSGKLWSFQMRAVGSRSLSSCWISYLLLLCCQWWVGWTSSLLLIFLLPPSSLFSHKH